MLQIPLITAKLITYNRAGCLEASLAKWNASPFKGIPLEILDNASTDSTKNVIRRAMYDNPKISYFRHSENIGAVGNVLRAYERFESTYCWVLCDDDELHLDSDAELLERIRDSVDCIITGTVGARRGGAASNGFTGSLSQYLSSGHSFYYSASFLPNLVFRRTFLEEGVIYRCNRAAGTLYPHAPLCEAILAKGNSIARLNRPLVMRRPNPDTGGTGVNWLFEACASGLQLRRGRSDWCIDFFRQLQLASPSHLLVMGLRWRLWGQLDLLKLATIISALPRRYYWAIPILLFCFMMPGSLLRFFRYLLGKGALPKKLETSNRF